MSLTVIIRQPDYTQGPHKNALFSVEFTCIACDRKLAITRKGAQPSFDVLTNYKYNRRQLDQFSLIYAGSAEDPIFVCSDHQHIVRTWRDVHYSAWVTRWGKALTNTRKEVAAELQTKFQVWPSFLEWLEGSITRKTLAMRLPDRQNLEWPDELHTQYTLAVKARMAEWHKANPKPNLKAYIKTALEVK